MTADLESRLLLESDQHFHAETKQLLREAADEIKRLHNVLRGVASCSTCGVCRGAAESALDVQAGYLPCDCRTPNQMQACPKKCTALLPQKQGTRTGE